MEKLIRASLVKYPRSHVVNHMYTQQRWLPHTCTTRPTGCSIVSTKSSVFLVGNTHKSVVALPLILTWFIVRVHEWKYPTFQICEGLPTVCLLYNIVCVCVCVCVCVRVCVCMYVCRFQTQTAHPTLIWLLPPCSVLWSVCMCAGFRHRLRTLHSFHFYLPAPCYGLSTNTIRVLILDLQILLEENGCNKEECPLQNMFLQCPQVANSVTFFSDIP